MKRIFLVALVMLAGSIAFGKTVLTVSRGTELLVEFTLGEWEEQQVGEYSRINAKDMDLDGETGAPLLPREVFKIGLPPSGSFTYSVVESEYSSYTLSSRLQPAPFVTLHEGMSQHEYRIDEIKYSTERELVEASAFSFRSHDLADFIVHPFVYDGQLGIRVYSRLLVRITLEGDVKFSSEPQVDPIMDSIRGELLNAAQAKNWRSSSRSNVNFADFSKSNWWIRVETNRDGIHRLNYNNLEGFPLQDIDPRQLRMFSTSGKTMSRTVVQDGPEFKEIPIYVSNEATGVFGTTDYILFYGSNRDSYAYNSGIQSNPLYINPYSQNQVFWLTFGNGFAGAPLRISELAAETQYLEQLNNGQMFKHVESEIHRREDEGFDWYSSRFFSNSNQSHTFQADVSDLDPSGSQSISMRLVQENIASTLQHNISVDINSSPVVNNTTTGSTLFTWVGNSPYTLNKSITSLVNGSNTIRVNVFRGGTDNLFFDYYKLSYRQNLIKSSVQKSFWHQQVAAPQAYRYNLSGSLQNSMLFRTNGIYNVDIIPLQNSNYFVSTGDLNTRYHLLTPTEAYTPVRIVFTEPTDLIADASQVDNIIITPAEFVDRANTLASKYWSLYGAKSKVIVQDDIFNQFSGGHPDPAAIRQAVRYFYHNLPAPKISSITLLGIGTIDWRNHSGAAAAKNKIMVWSEDHTASDDFYTMISAGAYPELAIGRYPVKTLAELDVMLQNFSNYTESPMAGWWKNSALFIGDDLNNGSYVGEDIHSFQTEEAANLLHPSLIADKIFAWEYEYDEFQNKPRARNDMFNAINEGRLVWTYIGHGSHDKLGAEDYLNGAVDMGRFNNQDKLPLFIASSCSVSHYDHWGWDSLGQKTVLLSNKGAIASLGANRITYPQYNQPMLKFLMQNLLNDRKPLGESIQIAKFLNATYLANNAAYVLLGDPLLRLATPERDAGIQISTSEAKNTLHSRDTATISGSFSGAGLSGEAQLIVLDNMRSYGLGNITVSHNGNQLYRGSMNVESSTFETGFVVPDDVLNGNTGKIIALFHDPSTGKAYSSYYHPLQLSDQIQPGNIDNPSGPEIKLFLGTMDFRPGDTVSTSPMLYANISDTNGVNITGANGHNILLVIDNSLQPIPITKYFAYNKGSYTSGSLQYQLSGLSEGSHTIQVIAFDNFNEPAVTTTTFVAKQSSELSIERLLVYPNPMNDTGYITFILSEASQVEIGVYTIRGKKIKTINSNAIKGFNSIPINTRDDKGASLANNTYFVKVKAISTSGSSVERTERMVIFK